MDIERLSFSMDIDFSWDTDGEFFRGAVGGGGAVLNHFKKFAPEGQIF